MRDTHSVELTPIGRIFAEESKTIVQNYEKALKHISDTAHGTTGYLKIGFMSSAVEPFLRDFVLSFKKEQPSIQLDFEAMDLDVLLRDVTNNRLDIAFATHVSNSPSSPFHVKPILKDKLCVAVSMENKYAQKEEIHISDLDDVPLMCLSKEENPVTFKFHEDIFRRHNANLNICRFVPNMDTAFFFVSLNQGICLLPSHLSHMASSKTTRILPVADEDTHIILNLIWRKDNMNPVVPIFCESFENFGKQQENTEFH